MTSNPTMLSDPLLASDEHLADRAQHNPADFAELYHRHFQKVYHYHLARTGHVQDAQDLTTQTFLAALENVGSYRRTGSFVAWLIGIARNKAAMYYRSLKHAPTGEIAEELPDGLPLPETLAGRRLEIDQVSKALRRLTPDQAGAIILVIICDLSAAEAAQVMQKSEAAVRMLLARGLKDLRERLSSARPVDAVRQEEK